MLCHQPHRPAGAWSSSGIVKIAVQIKSYKIIWLFVFYPSPYLLSLCEFNAVHRNIMLNQIINICFGKLSREKSDSIKSISSVFSDANLAQISITLIAIAVDRVFRSPPRCSLFSVFKYIHVWLNCLNFDYFVKRSEHKSRIRQLEWRLSQLFVFAVAAAAAASHLCVSSCCLPRCLWLRSGAQA